MSGKKFIQDPIVLQDSGNLTYTMSTRREGSGPDFGGKGKRKACLE